MVKTGYDNAVPSGAADAGWNLGLASTSSKVMNDTVAGGTSGAAPITTTTAYNDLGQPVKNIQPASNGADPGTRISTYYTSGTGSGVGACDNQPQWQGLLCQTGYAANPASGPAMVTTHYTYNDLQEPTVVTETSGGTVRTTTTSYDGAGRKTKVSVTVTGLAGSTPVPDVSYGYDATTGLPTTQTPDGGADGGAITTGYDAWGRVKSYATATGTTTTAYDLAGRTATVTGADGTTTSYAYDGAGSGEHRGLVTSTSAVSHGNTTTIASAYDAQGNLTQENYGGGVSMSAAYDTGGNLTGRGYAGDVTDPTTGQVSTAQPWVAWTQTFDALTRVSEDWTPDGAALSGDATGAAATGYARSYGYDPAGRLVQVLDQTTAPGAGTVAADGTVQDTGTAASCTVRRYAFDSNGNRTSKTVVPPNADGTCQAGANPNGAATASWGYNAADRTTDMGYAYDDLGRITTIPQTDTPAAQTAAGGGVPGDLTLGYYDTDQIRTQTQAGTTTTNTIDAAGRPGTQVTGPNGGPATSTTKLGYNDSSDSPAFETTSNGTTSASEAYLTGPDGLLAATLASAGSTQLAVVNPHGDCVAQITLPGSGDATGLDNWSDTDEYGNPTTGSTGVTATNPGGTSATDATGGLGYGWTGADQRVTYNTGLIQMGARVYDPATGAFASSDPVFGGNTTPYTYPQDPVDGYDLSGRCWSWCNAVAHFIRRHRRAIAVGAIVVGAVMMGGEAVMVGYEVYRGVRAGEAAIAIARGLAESGGRSPLAFGGLIFGGGVYYSYRSSER